MLHLRHCYSRMHTRRRKRRTDRAHICAHRSIRSEIYIVRSCRDSRSWAAQLKLTLFESTEIIVCSEKSLSRERANGASFPRPCTTQGISRRVKRSNLSQPRSKRVHCRRNFTVRLYPKGKFIAFRESVLSTSSNSQSLV